LVKSDLQKLFNEIVFLLEELEICNAKREWAQIKISLENVSTNAYFAPWQRNTDKVVFHQIKVIDAGAKGISSALMAK
jgi:hypothetical protein